MIFFSENLANECKRLGCISEIFLAFGESYLPNDLSYCDEGFSTIVGSSTMRLYVQLLGASRVRTPLICLTIMASQGQPVDNTETLISLQSAIYERNVYSSMGSKSLSTGFNISPSYKVFLSSRYICDDIDTSDTGLVPDRILVGGRREKRGYIPS